MPSSRLIPPLCAAVLASAGFQIAILGAASPASADPAPDPATFTSSGTGAYSGTVPDGACFVVAQVVGGAGGNSLLPNGQPTTLNGAAASISARYSVVPGESFAGVVGGGGGEQLTAGTNGGGDGGTIVNLHAGAGGGGWSSLRLDGSEVVVAGGGGGSGGGHPTSNQGSGGNAGLPSGAGVTAGSTGVNGADSLTTTVVGAGIGGGPANPGAGGSNSANASFDGATGVGRTGGNGGPDPDFDSGGGGGGGVLGGGGGASTVSSGVTGGGGGGGASFVAATSPGGSGAAVSNITSSQAGVRNTPGAGQDGSVSLDFVPCNYDLAVTKSVDDTTPAPGDTVTWTLNVTNNGLDPMTRGDLLTISDSLPGTGPKTITSLTVSGGSNNRGLARGAVDCGVAVGAPMPATLTCARPYADGVTSSPDTGTRGVDPGETITVTYTQQVPTGTPSGTILNNVATVTDRGLTNNNTDDATITVTAGPPVATNDSANTPFNTPVGLPATGNDSPSDPGTPVVASLTVFTSPDATNSGKTLVTPAGTWQVNPNGTVTFTPAAGYVGTTGPVEYRISDAAGNTDTADLTVTVRPGPSASSDTDTTAQGVTVVLDPTALSNDTPGQTGNGTPGTFDASSLVFTPGGTPGGAVSNGGKTLTIPGEGVFTIDPVNGDVTFDPESQFTGTTTPAAYTVTDSLGNDTGSTIRIVVAAVVPDANDDSANTPFNTAVTLPAVADDTAGGPSAPLVPSATVLTSPGVTNAGKTLVTPQGTWQVNPNGTVTFTPAQGYVGTTPPVSYQITDTNGTTDVAQLVVTVRTDPTAMPDNGTTSQDVNVTVPLLPNDTPGPQADGTPGSWNPASVIFTSPNATNGGLTLQVPGQGVYTIDPASGAVTFDPEPGFTGQATPVSYQVSDSNGNTTGSTLTITVTPAVVTPTPTPTSTPADTFDLMVSKRAVSGAQATVGSSVRYQLQVSNKGSGAAPGAIKLIDALPRGLELVSAQGKGWKCTVAKVTDKVSCVRTQALGAGRKASPVFVVAVATRAALGRVVNIAKVRAAGETVRSNNAGKASITVVPAQLPSTGFRIASPDA